LLPPNAGVIHLVSRRRAERLRQIKEPTIIRMAVQAIGDTGSLIQIRTIDPFPLDSIPRIPACIARKESPFKALACHRASWYPSAVPGNEGHT